MKITLKVPTILACLMTAPLAMAQPAAFGLGAGNCAINSTETKGGEISVGVLSRDNVSSSKFTEYREVPKGISVPCFSLFSKTDKLDFKVFGYNVSQDDQRYNGWFKTDGFDVTFDYNQILHNMGNGARAIEAEVSPGVWRMPDTLQETLGRANDATPTSGRNVTFYDALLASTFDSAGRVDVSSQRNRGTAVINLGKKLPFDLTLTYMRELKSGYRGEDGGAVYSAVSTVLEVPGPLNEITQDIRVQAAYRFDKGSIHGSFGRNLYNNRAETLTVDNPFQWVDAPYISAAAGGGPSRVRWINAPDNEASTGNAGFLLKFAKQTRIGGDFTMGKWTQNASFYPHTINSAILTPSGVRADSLQALQQPSFNGKIDTTTVNLTFSSRPTDSLALRAAFRSYDLSNKTNRYVITGDVSGSPDRVWGAVTPSAADPYGHATANVYDNKTTRFTASASYDIGELTLEAQGRFARLERTSREALKGDNNGYAITALFHASDWLGFRGTYDQAKRTAKGETLYGFQADEAERETKRTSLDVEFSLPRNVELTFAYSLRDVTYPNRPDRVPVSSGAPTAGGSAFPGTPSGLLLAKYDSYTTEIAYSPSEKVELGAYYTYEKDRTTNQWSSTSGLNLNNLVNSAGTDKTDTFGLNAIFQLKPEVWTLSLNAMRQKVDGLMDITAREAGSFYTPGRTTVVSAGTGGAADITDWDDTKLTSVTAQLDYVVATAWTVSAGYWYEKYDFKDAYTAGDLLMPTSPLIFIKSNRGAYDANVLYGKLSYRF
ncbi:MAG: MtrB/PioB family outer membrane beta-barrel protein [Vicinamibacteria bacterium]|nr:MtrB/PioB family outer membrane beta-barrel protein [Vicinamibacteria bacterium]